MTPTLAKGRPTRARAVKLTDDVAVGFAVGSGEAVRIPVAHMVVTGQTQRAGKTTALEALTDRLPSTFASLAFLTKRGESAFQDARGVAPYFREEVDWKFVKAMLEASMSQKMRFETPWIMRASKGATTLAEVQRNVQRLGASSKRSMDQDLYLTLDHYLEDVVPQIAATQWADEIELGIGANVVDLRDMSENMQHLVMRSMLTVILEEFVSTIVIIPEAWKFVPQSRGTPVKLAAESFIRQGAALQNFLWFDSQDITGIDKPILKQCGVWMLGVQREINEIKRTLDQIPRGFARPKPDDIATLKLGQFLVCHDDVAVKTYVQPTWLAEHTAQAIARDDRAPTGPIIRARPAPPTPPALPEDPDVKASEAKALQHRIAELERTNASLVEELRNAKDERPWVQPPASDGNGRKANDGEQSPTYALPESLTVSRLYEEFKARLMREAPGLIRVLTVKPEIEVTVTRKTITVDGQSVAGRVARLYADGFFDSPQGQGETRAELRRRGPDVNTVSLSKVFADLLSSGFFLKHGATKYVAVDGAKVRVVEDS